MHTIGEWRNVLVVKSISCSWRESRFDVSKAPTLQLMNACNSGSTGSDVSPFQLLWAPDMYMVQRQIRKQNTHNSPNKRMLYI